MGTIDQAVFECAYAPVILQKAKFKIPRIENIIKLSKIISYYAGAGCPVTCTAYYGIVHESLRCNLVNNIKADGI